MRKAPPLPHHSQCTRCFLPLARVTQISVVHFRCAIPEVQLYCDLRWRKSHSCTSPHTALVAPSPAFTCLRYHPCIGLLCTQALCLSARTPISLGRRMHPPPHPPRSSAPCPASLPSHTTQYSGRIEVQFDPSLAPVTVILQFLPGLFEEGKTYRTINVLPLCYILGACRL